MTTSTDHVPGCWYMETVERDERGFPLAVVEAYGETPQEAHARSLFANTPITNWMFQPMSRFVYSWIAL